MKKSDHLKLRCDDGNRRRPGFDDRAAARKRMIAGCREKWKEWMRRERRWMLILLQRERGKWGSGCVRAEFCQNWPPFYPQTTTFWESVQRGGKYIFTSCGAVNCEVKNISLYDCIDLCRLRATKNDGSTVICHTRTLAQCTFYMTTYQQRTFGTATYCMLGSHIRAVCSSLNWIDNTSAGGRKQTNNFTL